MTKTNVRVYTFTILKNVFYANKLLNNEIRTVFANTELSIEDKSFIKKECTGVIENLNNIDSVIDKYSKVNSSKLQKDILIALRLGIYEIIYMERVPNYATVNEYVNIIKNSKLKYLSGYVNAVLKKISQKELNEFSKSVVKRAYFLIYNNQKDEVFKELTDKQIKFYKYDGALKFNYSNVYYVEKYKYLLNLQSFYNGYILIMDASSVYLADALYDTIKSEIKNAAVLNILDTCASPGGKILALYDILNREKMKCKYEARDISNYKIDRIKENSRRLKVDSIITNVQDASLLDKKDINCYDVVICDVPCSGLGVINKKPDISLRFNIDKIEALVKLQLNILEVSKQYVKSGGILSYSTCTETYEENENNINKFLEDNSFIKIFEKKIKRNDDNKSDGFYICFMKKI